MNHVEVDENKLRELYLDKRLTTYQVADELGISQFLVWDRLTKLGICRNGSEARKGHRVYTQEWRDNLAKRVITPEWKANLSKSRKLRVRQPATGHSHLPSSTLKLDDVSIVKDYQNGISVVELTKKYKASGTAIYRRLNMVGVVRSTSSISKANWQKKDFVEKILKARDRKPNLVEIKVMEYLDKYFPKEWEYVGNYKVWFDRCNPDFININGHKKIIELNGCAWHCCPICDMKHPNNYSKDEVREYNQSKIDTYKKYGYDTLTIWEHEINNFDLVVDRIKEFCLLNNNKD